MRTKSKYRTISITEENYERLIKDRNEFEKTIGGGKWGINDTLNEYFKLLNQLEYEAKLKAERMGFGKSKVALDMAKAIRKKTLR